MIALHMIVFQIIKAFYLPEDEIKKVIKKQNRHRGVFMSTDRKAY